MKVLMKRYRDWKLWCRYTNDGKLKRLAALLGLRTYATLSFHAFRATLKDDWRKI